MMRNCRVVRVGDLFSKLTKSNKFFCRCSLHPLTHLAPARNNPVPMWHICGWCIVISCIYFKAAVQMGSLKGPGLVLQARILSPRAVGTRRLPLA